MKYFLIIPLIGILFLTSTCQAKKNETSRSKRSFGFSNPIFSRVFNPYDNRPLAEKFFDRGYQHSEQEDAPQYYPLWSTQPVLYSEDSQEDSYQEPPRYKMHYERPYPGPSKPYPEASKPYPPPSKPYPEAIKPHKPYPESGKPYAPSKPYPEASKPHTEPITPCPDHSRYPGSHQTSGKPAFGRLFVDEVDKNLRFEKDPKTGELVPVITDGRESTQNNGFNHPTYYDTERTRDQEKSISTTTARPANEYSFKLLPNYDIQTKFNDCRFCTTTQRSQSLNHENLNKVQTNEDEDRKQEEEYKKTLRTLRLLKLHEEFEEKKRKFLEISKGSDENEDPFESLQALINQHKKKKKNCNKNETTTVKTTTYKIFPSQATPIAPSLILVNGGIENRHFEATPQIVIPIIRAQEGTTTKKPCLNKTIHKDQQIQVTTERTRNVWVKILDNSNKPSVSNEIVSHNTRVPEDYTQFLAPPAQVIYQKFNPPNSLTPSSRFPPLFQDPVGSTEPKSTSSRGLTFRVFNQKLDQSVLDKIKDGDSSKLEELTHTVVVEPVRRIRPVVGQQFRTLESSERTLNVPFDRYGPPSAVSESSESNSSEFLGDGLEYSKPEVYFNIGDIPLEQNGIWNGRDRILVDSYGQNIKTKKIHGSTKD